MVENQKKKKAVMGVMGVMKHGGWFSPSMYTSKNSRKNISGERSLLC